MRDADGFGHETEMASNADPAASISEMSEAATASSPPTQGGGDDRGGDLAVQDVPMDDVPEGGEPEDLVQRSPRLDHDGEAPGGHMQERTDAGTEADIEHPELDSEIVAEVEPNSISKLGTSHSSYLPLCSLEVLMGIACRQLPVRGSYAGCRRYRSVCGLGFFAASAK